LSRVWCYGRKKSMEIIMNKLDNYELSTLHYTLCHYIGSEKTRLDEDEIEWLHILREKVDNIMQLQAKYDMECG